MKPLEQHQVEIQRNKEARAEKSLIRRIYSEFYDRIEANLAQNVPGAIVEIGAGSGELKKRTPLAISTDLFENPWLDLVCDAYALPFLDGALSNLVLLDVFHHLARPHAFVCEAARALAPGGRMIIFEPFISAVSAGAYGLFHHEPIAWRNEIDLATTPPAEQAYYAAQGNATRLFFRSTDWLPKAFSVVRRQASADFAYLLSGGLSKPALYPESIYPLMKAVDRILSIVPVLFGARALIVLEREP